MLRRPKPKPVLGLDISASSVKLVELRKAGTSYRVANFAVQAMPAEAIADKVVVNIEAVGEAIHHAWKRSGSRLKNVAVAVGGANVIVKTLTIPGGLNERESEEQIGLAATHIVPFSMDEVSWDFELLGPDAPDGAEREVLLVATRRENVEHRQAALEIAGLKAEIVDCESFALENAFPLLDGEVAEEGPNQVVAMVDFGATITALSVFHDGRIVYTRDQAFGGLQLTQDIMRAFSLSYEDAGRAKRQGGLPENYKADLLDPFVNHMAREAGRALQFFHAAMSEYDSVDRVVLCGGCAAIPGAAEVVGEHLGIPTQVANPIEHVELASRARSQGIERDAPALMVACGLALRSFS